LYTCRRWCGLAFALALLVAGMGLGTTAASAEPKEANQCTMPNGVDLNELYGVSEQIITPFCTQADAGQHVIEVYWVFNALHCDGLTADREQNCIPTGETLFREIVFQVTPGHH
jgi:hypothetical protein